MPFATTNYGWTLPDAGAEPFSWEPFVRTAFQGIDTTMFSKFDKSGGTITGDVKVDGKFYAKRSTGSLSLPVVAYSQGGLTALTGAVGDSVAIGSVGGDPLYLVVGNSVRATLDNSGNLSCTGRMKTGTVSDTSNGEILHVIAASGDAGAYTQWYNPAQSVGIVFGVEANGRANWYKAVGSLGSESYTNLMQLSTAGSLSNLTGVYGTISDAKLKRDVTDATPKLHKLLAWRIVNYYLIDDPTNTKMLGWIAQELQKTSPGLVEEIPDYELVEMEPARTDTITKQRQKTVARTFERPNVVMRDGVAVRVMETVTEDVPLWLDIPLFGEDGQRIVDVVDGKQVPAVHRVPAMEDYTETVEVPAKIESRATGTVTLAVKQSVVLPMAIKALQEMYAEFDGRLKAIGA